MDKYNYSSFDFKRDDAEMAEWLRLGPPAGGIAPDFELDALDGGTVRLSALRGLPVVVEFGSYTCPIFASRVEAMEQLARDFPEARFLVVYTREAHPGELCPAHRSIADKRRAAARSRDEQAIRRRVLVDGLDGAVHRAYGSAPDCAYVIDATGRIVTRLGWNDVDVVRNTLLALRSGATPEVVETLGTIASAYPPGHLLLRRGGRRALLDFYETGPEPVKTMFRTSADPEVRATVPVATGAGA
jgi:hypothetical protein